jgi:hypothetical protein
MQRIQAAEVGIVTGEDTTTQSCQVAAVVLYMHIFI